MGYHLVALLYQGICSILFLVSYIKKIRPLVNTLLKGYARVKHDNLSVGQLIVHRL